MLDSEYIKTLVKKAAEFGNGKIHIIVNNAGYTWDGVIHKVSLLFSIITMWDCGTLHVDIYTCLSVIYSFNSQRQN